MCEKIQKTEVGNLLVAEYKIDIYLASFNDLDAATARSARSYCLLFLFFNLDVVFGMIFEKLNDFTKCFMSSRVHVSLKLIKNSAHKLSNFLQKWSTNRSNTFITADIMSDKTKMTSTSVLSVCLTAELFGNCQSAKIFIDHSSLVAIWRMFQK